MIIFMSDILVFTNRSLCREDFNTRIVKLAQAHPKGIVLREKDLSEEEYKTLAQTVINICNKYGTLCILHNFVKSAKALGSTALHLPLQILRTLSSDEKAKFTVLGASCHSVKDAMEAEKLGCTYITAGHIFDTVCKKGLPGRGLEFLKEVCESVSVPVYAIGGIQADNIADIRSAGAAGACVMSGMMTCEDARSYLSKFEVRKNEVS